MNSIITKKTTTDNQQPTTNNQMKIIVNGETKEIAENLNLTGLLENLSLPDQRIAIELNKEVVRKKDWETIKINDADKIEIIHFVGGG